MAKLWIVGMRNFQNAFSICMTVALIIQLLFDLHDCSFNNSTTSSKFHLSLKMGIISY